MEWFHALIPSPLGAVIGFSALVALVLLWKYADVLGDGNVERIEREMREAAENS